MVHFEAAQNAMVYEYRVDFYPQTWSARLRPKLIEKIEQHFPGPYLFDFDNLFLAVQLPKEVGCRTLIDNVKSVRYIRLVLGTRLLCGFAFQSRSEVQVDCAPSDAEPRQREQRADEPGRSRVRKSTLVTVSQSVKIKRVDSYPCGKFVTYMLNVVSQVGNGAEVRADRSQSLRSKQASPVEGREHAGT